MPTMQQALNVTPSISRSPGSWGSLLGRTAGSLGGPVTGGLGAILGGKLGGQTTGRAVGTGIGTMAGSLLGPLGAWAGGQIGGALGGYGDVSVGGQDYSRGELTAGARQANLSRATPRGRRQAAVNTDIARRRAIREAENKARRQGDAPGVSGGGFSSGGGHERGAGGAIGASFGGGGRTGGAHSGGYSWK